MSALWFNPAFIDLACREAFSLQPSQLGTSGSDITGYPWALSLVTKVCSRLLAEPITANTPLLPPWFRTALARARVFFSGGPAWDTGSWSRLLSLCRAHSSQLAEQLTALVCETVGRVKGLQPGGVCIIPTGIAHDVDQPPIFLLLVIHRPESRAQYFELAVVNASGFGTEYHAFRLDTHHSVGGVERDLLLVLQDVFPERLIHSSFWLGVYRLLVRPAPTNVHTFYTVLLGHANGRPLLSNWITTPGEGRRLGGAWCPAPPLRTAGSCLPGALACLHYVLHALGDFDTVDHGASMLFFWWAACLHCKDELTQHHETPILRPFHATLLRFATKQFAALLSEGCRIQADLPQHLVSLSQNRLFLQQYHFEAFKSLMDSFDHALTEHRRRHVSSLHNRTGLPAFPVAMTSSTFGIPVMQAMFPMFGKFRKDIAPDFEALAGVQETPPLRIPVDLGAVANAVNTLEDVCSTLRNCLNAVTILANQRDLISHTYNLRAQLIQHVLLQVIPLPMPLSVARDKNTTCFWASQTLRRELQIEILRLLHGLVRHYIAVCFSLRNCREFDAARVIVLAACCTIADVVLRLPTPDTLSPLGAHYSGHAEGPAYPFVFDISFFSEQSEFFLLTDPVLNTARGQVLDYLVHLRSTIAEDHIIFRFDRAMELSQGDRSLLEQICLQYGFPSSHDALPLYFSGDSPEFVDFVPEWIYLRDIVFYFKALMVPDAAALPPLRRWSVADATLRWTYQGSKGQLSVRAFNMMLEGVGFVKDDYYEKRGIGETALTKFLGWIGMAPKRVPPSAADPTNLVPNHDRIETEDDVLHIKKLPTFGGRLSSQDSEVLLQYLTAPYLRIPLILQFFSDETRIDCLVCPELQNVVMAAVFEPSTWQRKAFKTPPEDIPPKQRDVLSTPLGLLFNELMFASDVMLESLEELLDIAIDKDTGHPEGSSAVLLLFVVRLTVYVCRYMAFLIDHDRYWSKAETRNKDHKAHLLSRCGFASHARGLTIRQHDTLDKLRAVHTRLRKRIISDVLPLLEDWAAKAIRKSDLPTACRIYAHIGSMLGDIGPHDYDLRTVSYLLGSLFFVFTHHRFTTERSGKFSNNEAEGDGRQTIVRVAEEGLGVPEIELFALLQKHRKSLLEWLRAHPESANEAMEFTVRLVSFTGQLNVRDALIMVEREDVLTGKGQLPSRSWTELPFFCGRGRFVTATEAQSMKNMAREVELSIQKVPKIKRGILPESFETALAKTLEKIVGFTGIGHQQNASDKKKKRMSTYELWLRAVTQQTADTEINIQTADFSLRNNPMELLDDWVNDFSDFVNLFGPVSATSTFQCAVVSSTSYRYWCRLIGRRHDLQRWQQNPEYRAVPEFVRPCNAATLRQEEAWVAPILEPWLAKHMPGAQLFIDDSSLFARSLESSVAPVPVSPTQQPRTLSPFPSSSQGTFTSSSPASLTKKPCVRLQCIWPPVRGGEGSMTARNSVASGVKEIVVTLSPRTIEVFDHVEEGRQCFTRLCYSSDVHHSFGAFPSGPQPSLECFTQSDGSEYASTSGEEHVSLASPFPPSRPRPAAAATLVITRCLSETVGKQKYIPNRHLHGLIPACLLLDYEFWQNLDDDVATIHGYRRQGKTATVGSQHSTAIKISILPVGPVVNVGTQGHKSGDGMAIVRRYTFRKPRSTPKAAKDDPVSENDTTMLLGKDALRTLEAEVETQAAALRNQAEAVEVHTLIDLKHTPPNTDAASLRDALTRIEDLGHILVWTATPLPDEGDLGIGAFVRSGESSSKPKVTIDVIEFPRLGLSFRATPRPQTDEGGGPSKRVIFRCDQHAGLSLSSRKISPDSLTARVLQGISNSLVLENEDGEIFLMTDAIGKPMLVSSACAHHRNATAVVAPETAAETYAASQLAPSILFDRNDEKWIHNLGDSRHYLYSVHSSRSYLFAPTPASALYLLLLRFLDRQYEEVCRSADAAHFFDSGAGAEEEQIWRILNSLDASRDAHPDAHASRIKIWLAASGQMLLTGKRKTRQLAKELGNLTSRATALATKVLGVKKTVSETAAVDAANGEKPIASTQDVAVGTCLWDIQLDVIQYCRKLPYVSGGCRLTPEEELEALRYFPSLIQSSPSLHNRQTILQAIVDRKRAGEQHYDDSETRALVNVSGLHVPAIPHIDDFDTVIDRTAVSSGSTLDAIANVLGSISVFKRPDEPIVGSDALMFYIKSMDRSFKLFNEWHFLYELLTNSCPIVIIPGESSYMWGALLSRYLSAWDFQTTGQLMSVLRIIIHNPQLSASLPHLRDDRKHKLPLGIMMRTQETFQKFFRDVLAVLKTKEEHQELQWPVALCPVHADEYRKPFAHMSMKPLDDITNRWTVGPRVAADTGCSRRELYEVSSLAYLPLIGITIPVDPTERAKLNGIAGVTSDTIQSFATQPLAQHLDLSSTIVYLSRDEMRHSSGTGSPPSFLLNTVSAELPFVLGDHAAARTPLGKSTLRRLQSEMRAYSERTNKERIPQLSFLKSTDIAETLNSRKQLQAAIGRVQQLKSELARAYIADGRFVDYAIRMVVNMTNYPPNPTGQPDRQFVLRQWGFIFGKLSGREPAVTFDLLVMLLLCPTAERELRRLNPFIGDQVRQDILSLTAAILFVVNRRGQLCRALHATVNLQAALNTSLECLTTTAQTSSDNETSYCVTPQNDDAIVKIRLLTSALTTCLDASRHYVTLESALTSFSDVKNSMPSGRGFRAVFDPRYLVFEFAYNILLRQSQIELIAKFVKRVSDRASLCHQAIMGAGKTTVVAPLLALLLADGSDLVVQVVPHTLLEFTRTVMQERFSAVIKKGVLTFAFSRYQSITPAIFSALIQAKEKKAVVLATPTSIKSVFLKVLQLFHLLDTSAREMTTADRVWQTGQSQYVKLKSAVGKMLKLPLLSAETFVDTTHLSGGKLTDEQFRTVRRELDLTLRTLNLFKSSVLLLDEVDLLLHPLRSELHWPIGLKKPLDFTRPSLNAEHQAEEDPELETADDRSTSARCSFRKFTVHCVNRVVHNNVRREAWNILEDFRIEIQKGLSVRMIQRTPHFVLLDEDYYHAKLKVHFARWAHLGLRALRFQGLSLERVLHFLCLPLHAKTHENLLTGDLLQAVEHLHDTHIKMLNHTRQWLNSYLPHILQKVNRVSFGIMTPSEIAQQLAINPAMPPSRLLLAVPFIGKDSPSLTSEFAHPDIIIGLTILAYRYDGLRKADFSNVLTDQLHRLSEGFGPVRDRPAAMEFIEWVEAAGGRVRGTTRRHRKGMTPAQTLERRSYVFDFDGGDNDSRLAVAAKQADLISGYIDQDVASLFMKLPSKSYASQAFTSDDSMNKDDNDMMFQRVWPLELVNSGSSEQVDLLYRLLWKEPLTIRAMLFNVVFPLTLQHASQQLSASGQELGGSSMFPIRLGFSGTPSELLPLELGNAEFEPGTDGQFIHFLSSPDVVSVEILHDNWNVNTLLAIVAARTDANAFIDSGALVTGKSNFQVARLLLETGLTHVDGVVYLDEDDRQMVLLRDGWRVIKIAQCGLSLERRFTFYDQVHTTGQDIKQAATARALITIGKDMTFRDFAQGAWRMRGIGMGQRLTVLIPPEVADLIEKNARQSRTLGVSQHLFGRDRSCDQQRGPTVLLPSLTNAASPQQRDLAEICAWLVIRGIQTESIQLRLLSQHNLFNIWRKNAFNRLCASHSEIGSSPLTGHLFDCLQLFREPLDFFISASPPQPESLASKLISLAEARQAFLETKHDVAAVEHVLKVLLAHDEAVAGAAGQTDSDALEFEAIEAEVTQEQEQEQEEEEEEEQEQEQEKEQEQQKEQEQEVDVAANYKYSRADEAPKQWKLATLCCPPERHAVFYPLSEFGVLKHSTEKPVGLHFPQCLWVSGNYFTKSWSLTTYRRLKNVLIVMEWIPNTNVTSTSFSTAGHNRMKASERQTSSSVSRQRLQKAFEMLDMSGSGRLSMSAVRELLSVLEIGAESREAWQEFEQQLIMLISQRRHRLQKQTEHSQTETPLIPGVSKGKQKKLDAGCTSTNPSGGDQFAVFFDFDAPQSDVNKQPLSTVKQQLSATSIETSDLLNLDDSTSSNQAAASFSETDLNLFKLSSTCPSKTASCIVATPDSATTVLRPPTVTLSELAEGLETLGALDEEMMSPLDSLRRRHFVLLSLEEAEGIRAAMHIAQLRRSTSVVPNADTANGGSSAALALRHVTTKFSLLDVSRFFMSEQERAILLHGTLQQASHACFRFLNSEAFYTERQVAMLLRSLQHNPCSVREDFFNSVRRCRRRANQAFVTSVSLSRIFRTPDDIALVQLRAAGARLRRTLRVKGLSLSDGFHAFDTDRRGRLQAVHIYAGLRWLGVPLTMDEFKSLWTHIPSDSDGFVSEVDFVRAFSAGVGDRTQHELDKDDDALMTASFAVSKLPRLAHIDDVLTPQEIRVLTAATTSGAAAINKSLSFLDPKIYERFKFKVQPHTAFKKVWEGTLLSASARTAIATGGGGSHGTSTAPQHVFSFWAPEQLEGRHRSITRKNRERVCLGHFVCQGSSLAKNFDAKKTSAVPMLLEIEDTKGSTMTESTELRKFIDIIMPHPVRFKLIWRDLRVCTPASPFQPLAIWKPIPPTPSMFAVLGYCVTDSERPPPLTSVRCLPAKWVERSLWKPTALWTSPILKETDHPIDVGTGTSLHHLIVCFASRDHHQAITDLKAVAFQLEPDTPNDISDGGAPEHIWTASNERVRRESSPREDLLSDQQPSSRTSSTSIIAGEAGVRIPRIVTKKASQPKGWF